MELENIIEYYQKDSKTKRIVEHLKEPQPIIHLKGMNGAAEAFVAASLFRSTSYHHLFIMSDKEEAAYLLENISHILPTKEVLFLPDSFKKSRKYDEINNHHILQRTEVINKISHPYSKAEIIVTYPEALFEKVVSAEALHKSSIYIKTGEKLDIETITELLTDYDFEFVDFVYEPGQFSIRGGIIDIFSYANEYPYRIELFDVEVESIRTFHPDTQLSEKKISSISIVPNLRTQFSSSEKNSFFKTLNPSQTIVWTKSISNTMEVINQCFNDAVDARELMLQNKEEFVEHPFVNAELIDLFVPSKMILEELMQCKIIGFGYGKEENTSLEVVYNISPQPSFNKNFELLIKDLKSNIADKYLNFIFSDNIKQVERFYHIFTDLQAEVEFYPIYTSLHAGFIDHDLKLACYTDHQIFNRFHKYSVKQGYTKDKALLLKSLRELQVGDFVTHIDHGVGRYSGLEKIEVNGQLQEAVRLIYASNDILYVSINSLHKISKYSGKEGQVPKIHKLGSDTWNNLKARTKAKIKDIAEDLIQLYAKRKIQKGFQYSPDSYLQTELEASFEYEDTPDQLKATNDVKADMEKGITMDRLVCGDVGFGKTEVAIRAAFKAVCDGKQVAILVPTTILAQQHYQSFKERLDEFRVSIDYVNRFRTAKEKKDIAVKLEEGKIDIIIGTHSIVSKQIKFKNLGLLVIDEEHKFGVAVKEKLKEIKANVDALTLTATPIPRTLQFSLMGARDLSVINTPPPNRQPVTTEVKAFNSDVIKEAIEYEVYRGGQVFFVHNKVKDIMEVKAMINKICPDVSVEVAHGQMEGDKLEQAMMRFINKESDVLLSTNIIESGLNVPNANTIIINSAHWFGLSDLHQLRGRVGRGNKKAFCYLIAPSFVNLTQEARQRLRTIEEFSDLGSGFNISMRDLDIRGAGNILGGEQSGFISEIGYDMYHKILDEAIRELKENKFKDLYKDELAKETDKQYVRDCQIDTDLEMLIPDKYIKNISERMSIYTELNNIEDEEQLLKFAEKLVDRFGKIPHQVEELFNAIRMKWCAKRMGMERIVFKNKQLKCYFTANENSAFFQSVIFGNIMKYIQENHRGASLKQANANLVLSFEGITTMSFAYRKLTELLA
jgi:transcription-repair coupling factor (superfamily II helicase)